MSNYCNCCVIDILKCILYNEIVIDINTMLCTVKGTVMQLNLHRTLPCYCILNLLCVTRNGKNQKIQIAIAPQIISQYLLGRASLLFFTLSVFSAPFV